MNHVNKLIALNSKRNLLWQFPGNVTKDGFLWDGQHRLKAAEANKWDFFYTVSDKTLEELGDSIVPQTNTAQLSWKPADYINWYAVKGNEQYVFLEELMSEYKLTYSPVLNLIKGGSYTSAIKSERLTLFSSPDEKQGIRDLLDEYLKLKGAIAPNIFTESRFVRGLRTIFKYVSSEQIIAALEKAPIQLVAVRFTKDYLRQFEEIFNYHKSERSYVRFF